MPDRPWIMRTYAGHSSAEASNQLFKANLARGQTGLSIAFDLPTQTGLDADHPLAEGEVGKVGVPIGTLDDLDTLLEGLPLDQLNTSLTINATAPWLLALMVALAQRRGIDPAQMRGTTQNDVLKEYLSRGTYIFPPGPSVRLSTDLIAWTVEHMPRWNPVNLCSYHLQEAGAGPAEEVAFTLANAIAVLDALDVPPELLPRVVGRISFFCNAGIRFVEETCKMRVFTRLWDRIARDRYGVEDPALRRFRYGVQVNSLGLTAEQPENNIPRIVLETLGVLLSRDARARALQLPAWNEALGLPRPWDQQWSLRIQQILAHETDLLEYPDLFEGSPVIAAKVEEIESQALEWLAAIEEAGGAVAAIESGVLKQALVRGAQQRQRAIASGEQVVVGVNRWQEGEPSGLGENNAVVVPTLEAERDQVARLRAHRSRRDTPEVEAALEALRTAAEQGENILPPSIRCAHAGVTTGEWATALRGVFGDYRAPTGLGGGSRHRGDGDSWATLRKKVAAVSARQGGPIRILIGKPGLDGHSNGAEQIALAARDAGLEVTYQGIRWTPEQLAATALEQDVQLIGLSVLSGAHRALVPRLVALVDVPVVIGGVIPAADVAPLLEAGVAAVFSPRDRDLVTVVEKMVDLVSVP